MKTMKKFRTWLILFIGFFILSTLMERGLIWEMYETIDGESISSYTTEAGEDNNLKVGYTGIKKSGFLIEEDYELNDGNKMFYIDQIQVISLNGFNF